MTDSTPSFRYSTVVGGTDVTRLTIFRLDVVSKKRRHLIVKPHGCLQRSRKLAWLPGESEGKDRADREERQHRPGPFPRRLNAGQRIKIQAKRQ
jgi:hypothetical protein